MSCVVCCGPTSLRCSGCRSVFYCSREHQKRHWSTHRSECKQTYEMGYSETLGRHLVAARDFVAGELVLREVALVLGPKAASECVCLGCHRTMGFRAKPCPGCGWPLCSDQCRSSPFHVPECAILQRAAGRIRPEALLGAPHSTVVSAYSFLTPLRCLLVKRSSNRSWQSLNDLQSHVDERQSTPAYVAYRQNVARFIGDVLGLYGDGFDDDTILKMCGILDTNSFEVKLLPKNVPGVDHVKARGLFPMASMIAHGCCPNTRHTFEQEGEEAVPWGRVTMAVYTTVPIRKGDILTATYTQSLWPTKRRRAHLQTAKCFSCECKRCSDPSELGSNFSSLRCLRTLKGACNGLVLPVNPLEDDSVWKCTSCHAETPSSSIAVINDSLHNEILERASKANKEKVSKKKKDVKSPRMDPGVLEEFLLKHNATLHPMNHHVIQVKHALNQIYGKVAGFTLKELSEDRIRRKERLCRELLDVADYIEPGMTRFRADLLYDLYNTLVEARQREITAKKISAESAKGQLEDANRILQEAMKILATEKDVVGQLKLAHENCTTTT